MLYYWICCCSVTKSCPTLCDSMNCGTQASLSFTISWSLLRLMSIESVMLPNHLILCHPLHDWVYYSFKKKWRIYVTLPQSILWSIKSLKVDENMEEEHKNNHLFAQKQNVLLSLKLSVALRNISHMRLFCFMFRSYSWKGSSRFGYSLPEGCIDILLKLFKFRKEYWYGKGYNDKPLQPFLMLFYLSLIFFFFFQNVRQSQEPFWKISLKL